MGKGKRSKKGKNKPHASPKSPGRKSEGATGHTEGTGLVMKQKGGGSSSTGLPGLSNLGNTCFFNSVLQNIGQSHYFRIRLAELIKEPSYHTELKLYNSETVLQLDVTDDPGTLTSKLHEFLSLMYGGPTGRILNPRPVFSEIVRKADQFAGYKQQDSQELLRYLLDSLRNEEIDRVKRAILGNFGVNESSKKLTDQQRSDIRKYGMQALMSRTFVDEVFGGLLVSTVKCDVCGNCTSVQESFLDLSLPVAEDSKHSVELSSYSGYHMRERKKKNEADPLPLPSSPSKDETVFKGQKLSKHQEKRMRTEARKAAKKANKSKKNMNINEFNRSEQNVSQDTPNPNTSEDSGHAHSPDDPSHAHTPENDPDDPSHAHTPENDPDDPSHAHTPENDPDDPSHAHTPENDPDDPSHAHPPEDDPDSPSHTHPPEDDPDSHAHPPEDDPDDPSHAHTPEDDPDDPSHTHTPEDDPDDPSHTHTPEDDPDDPSHAHTPEDDSGHTHSPEGTSDPHEVQDQASTNTEDVVEKVIEDSSPVDPATGELSAVPPPDTGTSVSPTSDSAVPSADLAGSGVAVSDAGEGTVDSPASSNYASSGPRNDEEMTSQQESDQQAVTPESQNHQQEVTETGTAVQDRQEVTQASTKDPPAGDAVESVTNMMEGLSLEEPTPSTSASDSKDQKTPTPPPHVQASLKDCTPDSLLFSLKQFCSAEKLTGDNKFACPVCTTDLAQRKRKEQAEQQKTNAGPQEGEDTAAPIDDSTIPPPEGHEDNVIQELHDAATPSVTESCDNVNDSTDLTSSRHTTENTTGQDDGEHTTWQNERVRSSGEGGGNSGSEDGDVESSDEGEAVFERSADEKADQSESSESETEPTIAFCEATKQLLIESPPRVLTLHLKRFSHQGKRLRKNNKYISFPPTLDLWPFCTDKCQGLCDDRSGTLLYSLYGVVVHGGGMQGGHYTCFTKTRPMATLDTPAKSKQGEQTDEQWYHASDTQVRTATETEVLKSQAYLLFYERLP